MQELKYDRSGLIRAVAQDAASAEVFNGGMDEC